MDRSFKSLIEDATELVKRLLQVVPQLHPVDWQQHTAAVWRGDGFLKEFVAHDDLDDIRLDDLLQIDDQKSQIERNTQQFLRGYPANNVLLFRHFTPTPRFLLIVDFINIAKRYLAIVLH